MGRIVGLFVLVALALVIAAIADCLGGENEPRRLTRRLWAAIILLLPIVGPIAWFTSGRPRSAERRPRPRPKLAPDDDPEFLRDLERRLREEEDGK